jgi:cobyrinic acid a,c-diamide synthase
MCGRDAVRATVARHGGDADLVVIEGMMGCFDGVDGTSEDGSTAQIAKWLDAPVVLVIDASSQSRSAAAVVLGFERFDPELRIGAVIANRVGGDTHARWVCDAIASGCRAVPLGAIKHDASVALPERHRGMVTATEGPLTQELRSRLAEIVEDRSTWIGCWRSRPAARCRSRRRTVRAGSRVRSASPAMPPSSSTTPRIRSACARRRGSGLLSPRPTPRSRASTGLYLGEDIRARRRWSQRRRPAVREFAGAGKPIYAECGGLMYLAEALEDLDGVAHPMVGLLPTTVRMRPRRLSLGYTEVVFAGNAPLGGAGTIARGHEFHYSSMDPVPDSIARVYQIRPERGEARSEGYLINRTLMSYVHLHFASNPALAQSFVHACAGSARPGKR